MTTKRTHSIVRSAATLASAFILAFGGGLSMNVAAAGYDNEETAALLGALDKSRLSLVAGLRQLSKNDEVPISAKFELDDQKQLSLSIYTAEKGLAVDPEHNVLKEYSGDPGVAPWAPKAEVFEDIPHVARASGHLVLMSLTKFPLARLVAATQKAHPGRVFSAIPGIEEGRGVLVVQIAAEGKVEAVKLDLRTGKEIAAGK